MNEFMPARAAPVNESEIAFSTTEDSLQDVG